MDIKRYQIEIKGHALRQAYERGIHPDLIEHALCTGRREWQGRHVVRFIAKGSKRTIICVARIKETILTIVTIEEGNQYEKMHRMRRKNESSSWPDARRSLILILSMHQMRR